MHDIKIIDQILDQPLFEILNQRILAPQLSWFFGNTTYKTGIEKSIFGYSFEHLVADNGVKNSPLYDTLEPILSYILSKNQIDYQAFLRIRLGLITASPTQLIHNPHVDYDFEHRAGLLYLNNTNAPTHFYNKKYDYDSKISSLEYLEQIRNDNFIVSNQIDSNANRLVLFDGSIYHSSSTPTDCERRVVLSFNYV